MTGLVCMPVSFRAMKRKFKFLTVSETGSVRTDNQDSFLAMEGRAVFCVADGMGGGSDGALASSIVCEELRNSFESDPDDFKSAVESALSAANLRVRKHAMANGYRQMGSTAVVLVFNSSDEGKAAVCNVGDSRVYRIRRGAIELLTDDHTLANQILRAGEGQWPEQLKGRSCPLSHVLTKAIGMEGEVSPEWHEVDVEKTDCYLICSDGVHDAVDEEIILKSFASADTPEEFSDALRAEIIRNGAPDNFTYIIIEVGDAR